MHTSLPVAVVCIVQYDNKILLLQRKNTERMNGFRGIPGGRLDHEESMTIGAIRELYEETDIEINEEQIEKKLIIQHKDERGERIYFVVHVKIDSEYFKNKEPEKCSEIRRYDIDTLPENITPQVNICLTAVQNNIIYSEYGYE